MPKLSPTVLLTRPRAQSLEFADTLRKNGFDGAIVISPLIEIVPTHRQQDFDAVAGAVFTSRNALDFVEPRKKMKAWCVGERTADKATALGWDAVSAEGDVESLYDVIKTSAPQGRLLHFKGEHSRGALVSRLKRDGIYATEVVVYQQEPIALTDQAKEHLSGNSPLIVPLFSPRSAALLAQSAPFSAPLLGVAMSRAVKDAMAPLAVKDISLAARPTAKEMCKSVLSLANTG